MSKSAKNQLPRIAVVDQHRIVTEALASSLANTEQFDAIGIPFEGQETFDLLQAEPYDVAVLDADLPQRSVFLAIQNLRKAQPGTRVVLMLQRPSNAMLHQALKCQAEAVASKRESLATIMNIIHSVYNGAKDVISDEFLPLLETDPNGQLAIHGDNPLQVLSLRQLEILRVLAQGYSVKEVSKQLNISPKSIDCHKYRIMNRLAIHDRVLLARLAIREGLIEA